MSIIKVITWIKDRLFSETFSLIMVSISFIGLIVSIAVFLICGNWTFSPVLDEEKVAQFGDFIGGVIGTLLAFSASLLYYVALKEQQKDVKTNQQSLNKQIEEFGKQVEQLEMSREVYEQQHSTMLLQQFENNFFSYFDIYLKVKDQLNGQAKSRDYFNELVKSISTSIKYSDLQGKNTIEAYQHVIQKYSEQFILKREGGSHYFRTLYRLVQIVKTNKIFDNDESQRMKYIKIIRSQLTENELLLIYYNIHSNNSGKARQLFHEYNILKHLPPLSKFEIKNKFRLSTSSSLKLSAFFDHVSKSIIDFINIVCGNPEDIPDPYAIEVEFAQLKSILKIEYSDRVFISISCSDMRVIPNNFEEIISDYFTHLLYISQLPYEHTQIHFIRSKDGITGRTIFESVIPIDNIKRIITDK